MQGCVVYMGKSGRHAMKKCVYRFKGRKWACAKCGGFFEKGETYYTQKSNGIKNRRRYCWSCHESLYV